MKSFRAIWPVLWHGYDVLQPLDRREPKLQDQGRSEGKVAGNWNRYLQLNDLWTMSSSHSTFCDVCIVQLHNMYTTTKIFTVSTPVLILAVICWRCMPL